MQEIKWTRGNEIELKKAVNSFNNKINKLSNKIDYLPDIINFQEAKKKITTQNELNRYIKELNKFKQESATNLYVTEAGAKITEWERTAVEKAIKRATNRLEGELAELHKPTENGYSKAQMGSNEVTTIERRIEALKKFETTEKGYDFNFFKQYALNQGKSDYTYRKSLIFRENYMGIMRKKYSHLEGYEYLLKEFNKIQDPVEFFKLVQNNPNLESDGIEWESDNTRTYSEWFRFLEDLFGKENFDKYKAKNKMVSEKYYEEITSKNE